MQQYLILGIAALIIIVVVLFAIKTAMSEARRSGASEERGKELAAEAKTRAEVTKELMKEVDPGDTESTLDKGEF